MRYKEDLLGEEVLVADALGEEDPVTFPLHQAVETIEAVKAANSQKVSILLILQAILMQR
jgi:hypothetical protein